MDVPLYTETYDIIYNQSAGGGNLAFCNSDQVCINEPFTMLIDPTFFNPSLDGIIEWSYNCNSSDQGELMSVWTMIV